MSYPDENTLFVCYCNGHDQGFLFDENLMERPKHKDCHAKLWQFHLDEPAEVLCDTFQKMQSWFAIMNGFYLASMLEPFNKATPEQRQRLVAKFERLTAIVGYHPEDSESSESDESEDEPVENDSPESAEEDNLETEKPEWLKRLFHVCYCNTCGEGVTYDEDVYTIPKEHEDCSTRLYQFDLTNTPEKLKKKFQTMEGLFDCAMDGFSILFLKPRLKASKATKERLRDKFDELLTLVDYPRRPRRQNAESLYFFWCIDHEEIVMFDENYRFVPAANHQGCPGGLWTYDFSRDPKASMIEDFQNMIERVGSEVFSTAKPFNGATPEQEARIAKKFALLKEIVRE